MSQGSPQGLVPIARSSDDRVVAGVAAGLARHLGVEPLVVRLAFAVASLATGFGIVAYLAAWVLMRAPRDLGSSGDDVADLDAVSAHSGNGRGPGRGARGEKLPQSLERSVAVGLIAVGVLLLVRQTGVWFPDGLVWPATFLAVGLGFVWSQADDRERARWMARAGALPGDPVTSIAGGRAALTRLLIGVVMLFVGLGAFVAANDRFAAAGTVAMALLAAAVGLALLLGPWIARLFRELAVERRERIRSEERAEMAAHLHDSVLQTLALIQRRSDSPTEMVSLARRQERELRAWLHGRPRRSGEDMATISGAFAALVDEVEAEHPVQVDLVVVGDAPLDDDRRALVAAAREAVVNAAKHADVAEVDVYVEVADGRVTAYVRDRGVGFDLGAVEVDRRGISSSVVGRMRRHGGSATVSSAPGAGTEIVLELSSRARS